MPSLVWAILIAIVFITIFIVAYTKNQKTPVPPGCENLKANCEGCSIMSCPIRKEQGTTLKEEK